MARHYPALAAACLLIALPALAQNGASEEAQTKLVKGSAVAIEGCVTAGLEPDTYVMGMVTEIPGRPIETGLRRVYWLDSRKHVRGHVGHRVQLAGRIDKIEQHELEVKKTDEGFIVEIEGPGAQVKTHPATIAVGTSGQTAKEVDIPTTVIRFKVDKVTRTGRC